MRIPADIRLIQAIDLKTDHSNLTGEINPQERTTEYTSLDNPLETKNIVFYGTFCMEGQGKGVVINTGDNTIFGRINREARIEGEGETPLSKEILYFTKIVSMIGASMGAVLLILGLCFGYPILQSFLFVFGIIVANVPEGLLVQITVSLSLTAKRMQAKSLLVKSLECVETLGSTTCICCDKTGTITTNQMTVENL